MVVLGVPPDVEGGRPAARIEDYNLAWLLRINSQLICIYERSFGLSSRLRSTNPESD